MYLHGHSLLIRRRLVRALLYLIAAHREGLPRDRAAFLLSPNEPQRVARRRLTGLLWHLRNSLGDAAPLVRADADAIRLADACWVDVHCFTATVGQIRMWRDPAEVSAAQVHAVGEAVHLYRGEFLSGFSLPQHPDLEGWILLERERLAQLYVDALAFLARVYALQGDFAQAVTYAQQGLEADPVREELHRLLMLVYAHCGQRAAALSQYERCVITLERELGVDPLPETRRLFQAILQGEAPPIRAPASTPAWVPAREPEPPFVGRKEALAALERAWQQVQRGEGRVLFVQGEPGQGKSRLVYEFIRRAVPLALVGAGEPGMEMNPYHPLITALRRALPTVPWDALDLPADVLVELTRLLPEVRTYRPDVPLPHPLDATIGQARMFEALYRFLRAWLTRPALLFIDDAHRTGDAFWRWFTFLSYRLRHLPLLIVFAYRPEEAPSALLQFALDVQHRGVGYTIELHGLTTSEIGILLQRAANIVPKLPPSISPKTLRQHTGGNPYFILETVRWLAEQPSSPGALPIPERVKDILQYRIHLLAPLSRHVLNAAAVLSPYLTVSLIARTAGRSEEETVEALEDLLRRHLLVETGDPQPAYRFAHEQLRQVTYDMIGIARRRHLHRRAAQALSKLRPTLIQDLNAVLAYHWTAAGEVNRALLALWAAIDTAAQQFAFEHVIHLADQALDLAEMLPPGRDAIRARMEAYLWRGRAHRALRHYRQAENDLNEAMRLAESLGVWHVVVNVLSEKIHMAVDRGKGNAARELAGLCAQVAERSGSASVKARALYLKEMVAVHFGLPVSEAGLTRALRAFRAARDHVGEAEVWNLRGVHAMMEGDYPRALEMLGRALALATRLHHTYLMHRIQANRGHVLYNQGDFNAAWEAFARAETWLHTLGVERPDNVLEVGRAYVAIHLGRSREAEAALQRALALALTMESTPGEAYVRLHLAFLRELQGRSEDARNLLAPLLARENALYPGTYAWVLEVWGWLLRRAGELRSALQAHRDAVCRAARAGIQRRVASTLCEVAYDLAALGRLGAACRLFHTVCDMAAQRGEKGTLARALIGLAITTPEGVHAAEQALSAAQATGSLFLVAEATRVLMAAYQAVGRDADVARLRQDILPRLQEAGWQGVISRIP